MSYTAHGSNQPQRSGNAAQLEARRGLVIWITHGTGAGAYPSDAAQAIGGSCGVMDVKRLIVCFDGTWNTPEDNTNVLRIFQAIADQQSGARDQLKFYDAGVGTDRRSMLTGGLFGLGLDANILQGYVWLCRNFMPSASGSGAAAEFAAGPEILIFGFSRGAFTARSLAGLISRCGLVRTDKLSSEDLASETTMRQSKPVQDAWELYRKDLKEGRDHPKAVEFRNANSLSVRIKFIGVWDTVGAYGIPTLRTAALPIRRGDYKFHDLNLSAIVDAAYHACAIDEHREDFNVALWDKCNPQQKVEQRWFPGAHANIGGGYQDDRLADISLAWIAGKAAENGLKFIMRPWTDISETATTKPTDNVKNEVPPYLQVEGDEYEDIVRDSYGEFIYGLYNLGRRALLRGRYFRPMLARGVNQTIDPSARAKWAADPDYRPRNLALAGRTLTPEEIGK